MRRIPFLAALVAALIVPPSATASGDWAWPVRGDVVTPYRNGDDPYAAGQHRGVDIAAPSGTRVDAATSGRVTFAGVAGNSGLTVSVRTGDGAYDVSYLHLSSAGVRPGDEVERGERIGAVGTSGRRSLSEPHLHLGVREAGERHAYRDPMDFLGAAATACSAAEGPSHGPGRGARSGGARGGTGRRRGGPARTVPRGRPAPRGRGGLGGACPAWRGRAGAGSRRDALAGVAAARACRTDTSRARRARDGARTRAAGGAPHRGRAPARRRR